MLKRERGWREQCRWAEENEEQSIQKFICVKAEKLLQDCFCTWNTWPFPRQIHVSCPSAGCIASEPHGRHAFWPGMGLKKSTGHAKQLCDVSATLSERKVPGGHGTGAMLPSGQKKPLNNNRNACQIFFYNAAYLCHHKPLKSVKWILLQQKHLSISLLFYYAAQKGSLLMSKSDYPACSVLVV